MPNAHIALTVNGDATEVAFAPYKTLLEVLREDLNLCGTKHGCELGECGACTVLVDGVPVLSCLTLPRQMRGTEVLTVEGLAQAISGNLCRCTGYTAIYEAIEKAAAKS